MIGYDPDPWNIYKNQQSRFTFSRVSTSLGRHPSPKPGQGAIFVMYDIPICTFDRNYSGRYDIFESSVSVTLKQDTEPALASDHVDESGSKTIVRRLTPLECERLMGWGDGWTATGIDDDGNVINIANTHRYRICGNGIVAPVTEWIGRRLMAVKSETSDD